MLIRWFVLGEKYPKAREALIEVRDQDVRKLVQGGGAPGLFAEVQMINWWLARTGAALHPDEAACGLFKAIHERNKSLAAQCYPEAERWLVQDGEYQLCLDYIGDPRARFESSRSKLEKQRILLPRLRESLLRSQRRKEELLNRIKQRQEESQRIARQMLEENYGKEQQFRDEFKQKFPGAPAPPPVSPAVQPLAVLNSPVHQLRTFDPGQSMTNDFVNGVRTLVEVLAGTGNKSEAEKIQAQAVAFLDDPRLKSAISDAEEKIQKRSFPPADQKPTLTKP